MANYYMEVTRDTRELQFAFDDPNQLDPVKIHISFIENRINRLYGAMVTLDTDSITDTITKTSKVMNSTHEIIFDFNTSGQAAYVVHLYMNQRTYVVEIEDC